MILLPILRVPLKLLRLKLCYANIFFRDINLRGIVVESITSVSKTVVVCVAGFEGLSSTAPTFLNLTEELLLSAAIPIAEVFRYDSTGIGLSDGKYYKMTIATLVDDLTHAIDYLLNSYKKIIFVGHSLGSCIISQFLNSTGNYFHIEKIILLAPALDQHDLHRYCKPIDVCKSYRARLCSQEDFSFKLNDYENHILHMHGNQDFVVPIESIKRPLKHTLIVNTNDHDLEEPDILQERTIKTVEFICRNE
ncbi:unnamed protein product [Rotaria socialis]|uniref:Serine aminopeptidase S33 domain-containing protein n=1 Tax=Rotaria socialis TaxID=392032 RepID=A0A820V2C6_9BILA|nr:unnamed protein product [Rotaria socialis]CAF4493526.1 unnamed protein product [Rotaria socialis]